MRIDIIIDDTLISDTLKTTGLKTQKEAVEQGLKLPGQTHEHYLIIPNT